MAGLKQSKRVSWATDGNLCKVRLFLSEDAPSQSGLGAQDHLQAKAAWLLHAAGMVGSDDSLPPGFEAPHKYQSKIEISQIPLIKWQCPPTLALNPEWLVVAGEESQEVAIENQRQPGVLEAIYPRSSSIPSNPSVAPEVQESRVNDFHTPLIPITAIEDEDGIEQFDTVATLDNTLVRLQSLPNVRPPQHITPDLRFTVRQSQSQSNAVPPIPNLFHAEQPAAAVAAEVVVGAPPGAEPDVLAAASAAFTAIMRSCEEGSLIDRDLLINILSNPSLVEKLVSEYGAPKQTPPLPMPPPVVPISAPPPPPAAQISRSGPLSAPISRIFPVPNMVTLPALNQLPPVVQMAAIPPAKALPVKDVNYYKSLIQLHGGDKQEALDPNLVQFGNRHDYHNNVVGVSNNGGEAIGLGGSKQRDLKPKIPKPCVYFNTPRGCRHGASCSYQHDGSIPQRIEQQKGTTKRIKLDRGIAGRN